MSWIKWSILLAALLFGGTQDASAQWGNYFGGDGGTAFQDTCSSTQHGRAINVRSGSKIDAVQLQCWQDYWTTPTWKPMHGGTGGTLHNLFASEFLTGITVWYTTTINAIKFTGYPDLSGTVRSDITETLGTKTGTWAYYHCPTGTTVTAWKGRSGKLLDAIMTFCAPR